MYTQREETTSESVCATTPYTNHLRTITPVHLLYASPNPSAPPLPAPLPVSQHPSPPPPSDIKNLSNRHQDQTPGRSRFSTFLGNATPARLRRLAGRMTPKSPALSGSSRRSRRSGTSRHSRSGSSTSSRKHRRQGTFPGAYSQRNSSELDHQRPPADPVYTFMIKVSLAEGYLSASRDLRRTLCIYGFMIRVTFPSVECRIHPAYVVCTSGIRVGLQIFEGHESGEKEQEKGVCGAGFCVRGEDRGVRTELLIVV